MRLALTSVVVGAAPSTPIGLLMQQPPLHSAFPWARLLTLAGAIFVSATSEILPTGLLPEIASGLGVDVAAAGLSVSVFAGAVVIATAPLALATRCWSRKGVVVVVLVVLAAANLLAATAPNFAIFLLARILGGSAHGLFWAVVSTYPSYLVSPRHLDRAIAVTSGGSTAAFVIGVPVATAFGHLLGWRVSFAVIAGLMVALAVLVAQVLPTPPLDTRSHSRDTDLTPADHSLRGVLLMCGVIAALMLGQCTLNTYIAAWIRQVAQLPTIAIPPLLFVYGLAGVCGLVVAGSTASRFPRRTFTIAAALVLTAMLLMAQMPGTILAIVGAFAVWGAAFGALPTVLQARVFSIATSRTRTVAGALQTVAFNTGIGSGALLGAYVLLRWGLSSLPLAAATLIVAALALSYAPESRRALRRRLTTRKG